MSYQTFNKVITIKQTQSEYVNLRLGFVCGGDKNNRRRISTTVKPFTRDPTLLNVVVLSSERIPGNGSHFGFCQVIVLDNEAHFQRVASYTKRNHILGACLDHTTVFHEMEISAERLNSHGNQVHSKHFSNDFGRCSMDTQRIHLETVSGWATASHRELHVSNVVVVCHILVFQLNCLLMIRLFYALCSIFAVWLKNVGSKQTFWVDCLHKAKPTSEW